MKSTFRKLNIIVFIFSIAIFTGCWSYSPKNKKKDENTEVKKGKFTGEKKHFWDNGKLKASIIYVNGLREGINKNYSRTGKLISIVPFSKNMINGESKQFYPNGSLNSTINYKNDVKHGLERWYYENGNLYRESNYVYGKLTGIQVCYYENGNKMSEAPFKDGQPGTGLKEYNEDGTLKKAPYIIVKETDNTKTTGEYIITYKLSDKSSAAKFYAGELSEGKYFNPMLSPIKSMNGEGTTVLDVKKGTFLMHQVNVVAKRRTLMRNEYIIQKKVNIAVENR